MESFNSDQSPQKPRQKKQQLSYNTCDISVIKHLPKPLAILSKPNYQYLPAKCLYEAPLAKIDEALINSSTQRNTNKRLMGLDEAEFEHQKIKDKINRIYKKEIKAQNRQTLSETYAGFSPYYSRFINPNKKGLANVLMCVNGIRVHQQKKGKLSQLPKLMTPAFQNQKSIKFQSHFESGNLLYVYKRAGEIQTYDLILQNDINTRGYNQWFFFRMKNCEKNQKIRLNIVNLVKCDSLFNYGLKVLAFSENRFRKSGCGWMRQGERYSYEENNIIRQSNQKSHYTLSFQYTFRQQNDTVFICPSYPYTYTNLTSYLSTLSRKQVNNMLTVKNIGESVGGNTVNVISISTGNTDVSEKNTKIVWVIARQHPSETTSSFMIEGIINYLVNLMNQTFIQKSHKSKKSSWLDNYTFKIVPMINVDGVIHGNTRSQLTGVDPNRMWAKPYRKYSPIINLLKKAILENRQNVNLVLDLHSHSKKTGCFFFGNQILHNPKLAKVYPSYVCENDDRFSFKNCRFRGGYESTMRKVLFSELPTQSLIYTVQCSLYGYEKSNKIIEFTTEDYRSMGSKLISSYLQLEKVKFNKTIEEIIADKSQILNWKDQYDSARSDSSLSDDEFEQIYNCRNKHPNNYYHINKKKKMSLKINKQGQETENKQLKNCAIFSLKQTHEQKKRRMINASYQKNYKISKCQKISPSLQNINSKFTNNPDQKQKKPMPQKKIIKPYIVEEKSLVSHKKIVNYIQNKDIKSIGVQVMIQSSVKSISKLGKEKSTKKKDTHLCIVGSSIEDDRSLIINKNQVAIQHSTSLQSIDNQQKQKEGMKQSKSAKIPKILSYLCNNMMKSTKQNAVSPQQIKQNAFNSKSNVLKHPLFCKN